MEDSEIESAGAFVIDKTHVLGFLLRRGAWEPNRAGTGSRAAQLRRTGNAARVTPHGLWRVSYANLVQDELLPFYRCEN